MELCASMFRTPDREQDELRNSRILIVDDEADVVMLLKKILNREGFHNLVTTTRPTEALDLYMESKPDVVIMDLNMPVLNGFQVLEQLNRVDSSGYVPVMVLTGQNDLETRVRALNAGARDFLEKPFTPVEALARLRNILEVRQLYQRTRASNVHLQNEVNARAQQLLEANLEMIRRLCMAAEFRDDDTGNHINRISLYSAILAEAVGLGGDDVELIRQASPMHDIGKIGIPDQVLLKPGKLTPEEWDTMKGHAEIGARLLSNGTSDLMRMAETIALTHHEKWDGSGYPRGLSGQDIPLPGRIVAVCDVFDALTSNRPYKKAWPVEEAIEEIRRGSGRHFDPQVVEAFQSALSEILRVRDYYANSARSEAEAA